MLRSLVNLTVSTSNRGRIVAGGCAVVMLLTLADAAGARSPAPSGDGGADVAARAPAGGPIALPSGGVTDITGDRRRGFGLVFGTDPGLAVDYVPEARAIAACRASHPPQSTERARCLGANRTMYAWLQVVEETVN